MGIIGNTVGQYGDNGKEHGNYYLGFRARVGGLGFSVDFRG